MERFAFKAMAVMPHLILQKSSRKMKAPEIRAAVEKRMDMWKKGQMEELFDIAQTIQQRFIESHKHIKKEALAKSFASLIFQGKINAAIRLLTQNAEQKGVSNLMMQSSTYSRRNIPIRPKRNAPPSSPVHLPASMQ